jgi:hypothetical protein
MIMKKNIIHSFALLIIVGIFSDTLVMQQANAGTCLQPQESNTSAQGSETEQEALSTTTLPAARKLKVNWLSHIRNESLERFYTGSESAWLSYVTNKAKNAMVGINLLENGFKLQFYFTDPTHLSADTLYGDSPYPYSFKQAITKADEYMQKMLIFSEKYCSSLYPNKQGHSIALRYIQQFTKEKIASINNETDFNRVLRYYISLLMHLIAVADEQNGAITNPIDKLLYLNILYLVKKIASHHID